MGAPDLRQQVKPNVTSKVQHKPVKSLLSDSGLTTEVTMKLKALLLVLAFGFTVAPLLAQQATLNRNSNLRSDSSNTSTVLERLKKGARVTLLNDPSQGGYFHVTAEDGQRGWVWGRNLSRDGTTANSSQPTSRSSSTTDNPVQCDDSLWDQVYNPHRLIVTQKCVAVTGIIVDATNGREPDGVRHEADGDTHGWLQVDSQFTNLLNAGNMSNEGGNLVFEIVCKFPVTQADAVDSCPSSYQNTVVIPPIGTHVRIVGSYVQDTNHAKWMEIHPVTSIEIISNSQ